MTSIVKLEALSGVKDDGPLCYLLQLDDSYILLDCGWDDTFDLSYIAAVKDRVQNINAVLITYPDIPHLGALPYLVAKCGLNCPVYATVPVFKMGQMFMYDWVNGHTAVEDFDLFSLDDVDTAFERVQQVKYNQTILLKGDNGIQFTPIAAGHMIGGAIWKISKQGDEEIIYAVDYNHKKERHLNGALFDNIVRPHLFITDAFNAAYSQSKRRDRDEELVTKMLTTVKGGGDCLVVIDTAGRILEIAHLLDGLWANSDAGLSNYNLVMLSHVASTVVDFAKSQVEWMSEKILKSFENGRYNPFSFRNVQLCHSLAELARVRSPKVVLCSGTDMESGFSRELFLEWSSDTRNCIILTCRAGTRTLASKLIAMTDPSRNATRQVQIEVKRRIRLEGMELEQYKKRKMEKEQEAARLRLEQTRRNARVGVSRDDDEDEDSEDDEALANAVAAVTGMKPAASSSGPGPINAATRGQSSNVSAAPSNSVTQLPAIQAMNQLALEHPYDLMLKFELQQKSAFFKQTKKTYPMFHYVEDKVRWDDYGEIIRPEEYITNDSVIIENDVDNNDDDDGIKKEIEEKAPKEQPKVEEWPTKCISYHQKLEVLCKLEFIDFEGRSDGESIKKILAQIKPKQLIIVHGSKEATRHLAQYAHDSGIVQGRIFSPNLGQIVDATVESHIYQVTLSDAVMTQMLFQPVRDAELSWIDARILRRNKVEEEKKNNLDEEIMEIDNEEENSAESNESQRQLQRKRPNVFHLEALAHSSIPSHQAVFVNDPKLSDLKQILVNAGYQAEFSSGVLYINGIASIKRNEAGKFHVEGCAGLEYYKIRDVIYNQFAII